MSNGAKNYKAGDRKEAIDTLLDTLQGTPDQKSVYDDYSDLQLTDMKSELTSKLGSATLKDRDQLHFDLALYRSLRYAAVGSKHCLVLGAINNIRELYEGQVLRHPNDEDPEGNTKLA